MRVLVTRPEPGAAATARLLREEGYKVIVDPALHIHRLDPPLPTPDRIDRVLLTSAQAAYALERYKDVPVYAVGEATARAARRHGAVDVHAADDDWEDLVDLALEDAEPETFFLHLAGKETAGEVGAEIQKAGHRYERVIVYETRPSTELASRTKAALTRGGLSAVLLFSPRSARIWRGLIEEAGLVDTLNDLDAVCLSANVADVVRNLPWSSVRVAARRDQDAMLDCLDEPER